MPFVAEGIYLKRVMQGSMGAIHGEFTSDAIQHQRFSACVDVASPMPQTWMTPSSFLALS
jgi:hypothetical protein